MATGYGECSEQLCHLVSMGTVFNFLKSDLTSRQLVKLFTTHIQYNATLLSLCGEICFLAHLLHTHARTHAHARTQKKKEDILQ